MAKRTSSKRQAAEENSAQESRFLPALKLFGHEPAEAAFLSAYNQGTLHHAWLLGGERGIGKASFAYRAARFLLSRSEGEESKAAASLDVDPDHAAARQVGRGMANGLFVLGEGASGKSAIGIDEARALKSFLTLTRTAAWRVVIVDAVNDLNVNAANALLKGIEEPPSQTVFFLVNHGGGGVLSTIRSRCVRLTLRPLDEANFRRAVNAALSESGQSLDAIEMQDLFAAAQGSPGVALALVAEGGLAVKKRLDNLLGMGSSTDFAQADELVRSAAANAAVFATLCNLIERAVEEKAVALANTGNIAQSSRWASFWSGFRRSRAEVEVFNLDKGAFLLGAFSDMSNLARGL